MNFEMAMNDQISIICSIFLSLAGISGTIVGFIITAYILRRERAESKSDDKLIRNTHTLNCFLRTSLGYILSCFMVVIFSLRGPSSINEKEAFIFQDPTTIFLVSFTILAFNISEVLTGLANKLEIRNTKGKNNKKKMPFEDSNEFIFSVAMCITVIIFVILNNLIYPGKSGIMPILGLICFGQISAIFQVWNTLRKD